VVILTGRAAKTGWVVAGTGVRLAVAWVSTRPRGRRDRFEGKLIKIGMRAIHQLGATFIKFAQLLSTRVDVLPAELCARLAVLHDDVPAIRPKLARRLVAKRLGAGLDAIFAEFDAVPVASGSIACVYRAVLHDGSVVALKLRRPGVDKVLGADFTLMRGVARLLAKLPAFRSMPVREMVGQMGGAIAAQLDFTREAASATAFAENLREMPGVVVPKVRTDVTGPAETGAGILALEFIPDLVRRDPRWSRCSRCCSRTASCTTTCIPETSTSGRTARLSWSTRDSSRSSASTPAGISPTTSTAWPPAMSSGARKTSSLPESSRSISTRWVSAGSTAS
jgi:ubiquinone biosynthesis protein